MNLGYLTRLCFEKRKNIRQSLFWGDFLNFYHFKCKYLICLPAWARTDHILGHQICLLSFCTTLLLLCIVCTCAVLFTGLSSVSPEVSEVLNDKIWGHNLLNKSPLITSSRLLASAAINSLMSYVVLKGSMQMQKTKVGATLLSLLIKSDCFSLLSNKTNTLIQRYSTLTKVWISKNSLYQFPQ